MNIEKHGPDFAALNAVASAGQLLSEIFGFASSGDPAIDHKERAKRAYYISTNALDAVDALQRESLRLDPSQVFLAGVDVEKAWQAAALERLEKSRGPSPTRDVFESIEGAPTETGRGLDGSTAAWFPWDRPAVECGPDLTMFIGAFTDNPEVAYYIYEAKNDVGPHGAQLTGPEVAFVREVARVDSVARFSYHLRNRELERWINFVIYHVLASEFMRHDFDNCTEIRFRDLDTDIRTLIPYPMHSLAEDDM